MQLQVLNSPFDEKQVALLNQLLPGLTTAQKLWLGGYISALPTTDQGADVALLGQPQTQMNTVTKEVTILYGSQTGNCQNLAEEFEEKLKGNQYDVTLSSMHTFKGNALKKVTNLLLIVSTHGEGDAPDTAIPFYDFLHSKRAPKLNDVHFSVLALGDRSYEFFCQTGKDFDQRLTELGGTALVPRVDCDLDFDEPAAAWFSEVTSALQAQYKDAATIPVAVSNQTTEEKSSYSRTHPFEAEVFENINLNGRGSNKETRHLELSLEGSNLQFEPGDSLGIYPTNDPELVDAIIAEMNWNPEESITLNREGDLRALKKALTNYYEITVLTKPLLEKLALLSENKALKKLVTPEQNEALKTYMHGRDVLDVLKDYGPWHGKASDFTAILRKIPPRLYSIASSYQANPDEVHLTIGTVRYTTDGRERFGVCSEECASRITVGDTLPVYVQKNRNFALPENPNTPIIMVGPGTGVAPFRSFLEEREELEAKGKSWLFFGDQHYVTDFLYQVDWQRWIKEGVLSKMDVAFSRDTAEKVYVQHKMIEHKKELYTWLEEGAVFYVCGDETYMATDVHDTLLQIIQEEGNKTLEEAHAYIKEMQQENRYQRDVY